MIISFEHKGLELFWTTGSKKGIQPAHAKKLLILLTQLNSASRPTEMAFPGWHFHPLSGTDNLYSVRVNGNWRVTWRWKNGNAEIVDYVDYH